MSAITWTLSGFGDEIDPDPVVQLDVLQSLGASHLELRSAWGVNVIDLDDDHVDRLRRLLEERGMQVSAIASPIGKVNVSVPVDAEVARLRRAIHVAQEVEAPFVRVFSFYRPAGVDPPAIRDAVIERMAALAGVAEREGVTLVHENEKDIFGDIPERVLDIIESVGSRRLRVAWDNANFVQVGIRPFSDAYPLLREHLVYLQVKDAFARDGVNTVAGEGDGEVRETLTALRDDGYSGFASLEPHLVDVHSFGGFSGPREFARAARSLRAITDDLGVVLA